MGSSSPAAGPMDFDDFEVHGAKSAPSGLSAEERLGGAAAPARPEPVPVAGEVLHPDSKVETMRARLRELDQPIYGTKEVLWTRLSRAEKVNRAHQEKLIELRERHERVVEERPTISPRVVPAPGGPTPEEREAHNVLHMTPAAWCEFCAQGNQTTKPHRNLTYDQKDIAMSKILLDFAYLKTDGEWCMLGEPEPPAAELFATTLIMVDSGTLTMRAVSLPTKAVGEYSIASVLDFMESLNLERTVIKTDDEPTICALAKAVKARRMRATDLEHGSLKDSASMGGRRGADPLVASEGQDFPLRLG